MKTKTVIILLATAALLPLSCQRKPDPQVLARVGFSEIRVEQFQQQMVQRGGSPPKTLDKSALLQEMIEQEALFVRAVNAGLDKDPEIQRTWRNLVISKFKERELAARITELKVTPEELQAAYEKERVRYTRPESVRLAVLYLKNDSVTKPEKIAELQPRMAEAREKALATASSSAQGFGALAIGFSEDQATRYHGGILGWVERNRGHAWLGSAAIEAGYALKAPGDISEVITDPKGVYLIKLLDRREASLIPLADVEMSLRQRLLVEKRRQLEQMFINESLQSVPVETNPELLARIPQPSSTVAVGNSQPPSFP